jgi:hypothetical protein
MVKPVSRTMAKATVGIGMKATNGLVDAKTQSVSVARHAQPAHPVLWGESTVDGEGKGNGVSVTWSVLNSLA